MTKFPDLPPAGELTVQTTDDRLRIEVELVVPVERAWSSLTSPDAIAAWWGDHVRLVPRVGGTFREAWTNASGRAITTTGVVTKCEPPAILELTWSDDDWPTATSVRFALQQLAADRSSLSLEHCGWEVLPAERRRRLIDEHAAGWASHLQALRSYLERSSGSDQEPLPSPDSN